MGFFSKIFKSATRVLKSVAKPAIKAISKVIKSPITSTIASLVPGGSATLGLVKGIASKLGGGGPGIGGIVGGIAKGIGVFAGGIGAARAATTFAGGKGMSLLGTIIKKGAPVATGAAVGAGFAGGGKRRRRRKKRLTQSEITELMQLKMLFGARSPVVTLAGLKMLNRGG